MVGARRIRAMIVLLGLGGCTLQEITIVEVEDVVVAEVHVQIGEGLVGIRQQVAAQHDLDTTVLVLQVNECRAAHPAKADDTPRDRDLIGVNALPVKLLLGF